jgi:hypothetical protein
MKFKQIAAVVALAAASVPAFAELTINTSGNSALVFVMYDTVDQVSYALDLGLALDAAPLAGDAAFNGASSYSYNLSGSNFSSFLGAAAASSNTLQFAVFGGEAGGSSAGNRRLFSTVTTGANSAGTMGNITTSLGNIGGYFANLQSVSNGQTFISALNGDGWASAADTSAAAYFMTGNGMNKFNVSALTWTNNNAVGTAATFRSIVNTAGVTTGSPTTQTDFAGVWSVNQVGNAYTLTYSAVPEADGLALMLAGFGAVGFLARRRKAA